MPLSSAHDVVVESESLPPVIHTERVVLRPFALDDARGRQQCGRDPEIIRSFGGSTTLETLQPMSFKQAQVWYQRVVALEPRSTHWAVQFGDRFVGTARLHAVEIADRRARYAVGLLDRSILGMGLGTEITQAVVGYGFDELQLHRIDLRVLAYNTRAIQCYTRCGFVEDGRERDAVLVDGAWHDDVIMSILEPANPSE
jgi:ribosomal-protein-alanine N-acetyltransferase